MDLSQLFPLFILLLFIPIFLSGRKQRRQMAEMQQMQSDLVVGDIVVTASGLRATVVDVSYKETVDLEIADDVITTWVRGSVREKVVASEPADALTNDDAPPSLVKDNDSNGATQS
ncbi:preprotein translocase subunit YajC [Pseudonocardia abyssalis]|uniref:Preprotein translocase subunit YajC n=1 Tax=Pseudonocardia abyssalis TaxID=2792008 RepID=A0ABS6UQ95_9PSEU|nr:preprotein translocase subunit YajC [Pseudonocardia abyssalis]MBW0117920.1 preprotein translocase subunit YajC [Pseudonocardia abyssalis]MBW0134409.1 preprotein translocase subunit YajC [Pseudonocardia abyssalis]